MRDTCRRRTRGRASCKVIMNFLIIFGLVGQTWSTARELTIGDVTDLVMDEVLSYDEYVYNRYLQTEQLTCEAALSLVPQLQDSFSRDLNVSLTRIQRYMTLRANSEDVGVKACVVEQNIKLINEIEQAGDLFKQCSVPALPQLNQLLVILKRDSEKYYLALNQTLTQIQKCDRQFHNKESARERTSCQRMSRDIYFKVHKTIATKHFKSPCMDTFERNVVNCIMDRVDDMAEKIDKHLKRLDLCVSLDSEAPQHLPPMEDATFKPAIKEQISMAQAKYKKLNEDVQNKLKVYYDMENKAKRTYVINPKKKEYFKEQMYKIYYPYYVSINQTAKDNPEDCSTRSCAWIAWDQLDEIVCLGSQDRLECNGKTVEETKKNMANVRSLFFHVVDGLKTLGNVAILDCLSQGYIFGVDTIGQCYSLKYRQFSLYWEEKLCYVEETVAKLQNYTLTFLEEPDNPHPCKVDRSDLLKLAADYVLYNYQSCLYQKTGVEYPVTLPPGTTPQPTTAAATVPPDWPQERTTSSTPGTTTNIF